MRMLDIFSGSSDWLGRHYFFCVQASVGRYVGYSGAMVEMSHKVTRWIEHRVVQRLSFSNAKKIT